MRGPRRSPSVRSGYKPYPVNEADAGTTTRPAPVGGWNARDSLANMSPLDAVVMDNIFPGTSDVSLRPGSIDWVTGIPSSPLSLMGYNSATGSKLFVSTADEIYDATITGAVGASVSSCTDGKWTSVNFANTAGSFLVMVNGVDDMKNFDGTTWTDIDAVSTPAITGVATNLLNNLCQHKRRLWFVQRETMDLWYLAVDAIAGAATKFPLGPLFSRGGHLVAVDTWTVDGGQGSDDLLVAVTSNGELAIYQGTDPSSTSTWALVGVYYIGQPVGRKCLTRYGGDLLYLSQQGLFPLSKLLLSATIDRQQALSNKIDGAFLDATSAYSLNYGWSATVFPNANLLLVNIPVSGLVLSYQYVMNNITKAWCRFTNWNATCWTVLGDDLYFAGGENVYKAWSSLADSGSPITGQVQQAYNSLGVNGQKEVVLVRPNVAVEGNATLALSLDADYKTFGGSTQATFIPQGTPAVWDVALWGTGVWDSGLTAVESKWLTVPNDLGYLYSLRLQLTTSSSRFSWTSTDFAVRRAGIL
jgi:hypothetical protein